MIFVLAALGITFIVLHGVYPFLAVTDRIETKTMVVEGWMDQTDLAQAVDEFRHGKYNRVFTVGGPVHGIRRYVNDHSTGAYITAQSLIVLGLPREVVQCVPSHIKERDRTYGSATALRKWTDGHHIAVSDFIIVTEDVHARRSRLLFRRAFGNGVKIGVIALPNTDYDAGHWWRYSEGVKDIVSEGAAYIYARFFFYPH